MNEFAKNNDIERIAELLIYRTLLVNALRDTMDCIDRDAVEPDSCMYWQLIENRKILDIVGETLEGGGS